MSFLGLDLGTSGLRALLIDEAGAPIASTERTYGALYPHPGWSEQDPADWIAALDEAVAELRAAAPGFSALKGVGVAGHMHGATLLDAEDRVLRPCILWNDSRAHEEAARLDDDPAFRAISGNIVFPGFTAPKLEWVRAHEPEIHARVEKVLLPAAYLNLYLTGDHVADMSDSAGSSWLDIAARDWSEELLRKGGLRAGQMPRLIEGAAPAGVLRPDLARRWGLSGEVVVAGGAGDNAAAACGIGALREGEGFVSLGTSGVVLTARDACRPASETAVHTFCHAVPDRWYQMSVMLAATDSLNWLSRIAGRTPAALAATLGDKLRPPGRTRFLPYLSGERTPHNDAEIRGAFTGLSQNTGPEEMTQAVLEGVAFGLRDGAEALLASGARLDAPFVIGGGAASRYWVRLVATALNRPLRVPAGGEFGAALGAARLGLCAATGAAPETVMTPPATAETVDPDLALAPAFDDAYERFRAAYPAIKAAR